MTRSIAEFEDPRLVAVYDAVNGYGPGEQPDFYASVATEVGARTVVELGSGTGMLALDLAKRGFTVTGVEPSAAMLERARAKPGADAVTWIHGGAEALGTPEADLAVMSGHVAQFFVGDDEWLAALAHLHGALRPGGHLAFESRNPDAQAWEHWTREHVVPVVDPVAGLIDTWTAVHDLHDGTVEYANHYHFARTDEELVSTASLRFRTLAELTTSLAASGFTVEQVFGTWDRRPVSPTAPEHIVLASSSRPGSPHP